jgi:hypothetical protein
MRSSLCLRSVLKCGEGLKLLSRILWKRLILPPWELSECCEVLAGATHTDLRAALVSRRLPTDHFLGFQLRAHRPAPWLISRNLLHFWTVLYQVVGLCSIETESCISCWIVSAQWMIRNVGWLCTRSVRNVICHAWIWFHALAVPIGAIYLKIL